MGQAPQRQTGGRPRSAAEDVNDPKTKGTEQRKTKGCSGNEGCPFSLPTAKATARRFFFPGRR